MKQTAEFVVNQTGGSNKQANTTLYQAGRKDAFAGTNNTTGDMVMNYGESTPFSGTLANGIANPNVMYQTGAGWGNNVPETSFYNLWDAQTTSTAVNDNNVVKTVYDPTPSGFKLPPSNAFKGFVKQGTTDQGNQIAYAWINGAEFIANPSATTPQTIYFPAAGLRSGSDGTGNLLQSSGYYYSAGAKTIQNQYYLYFWNYKNRNMVVVEPNKAGTRSDALAVRPISE